MYVLDSGVPSKFARSIPSPRKRKIPMERHPLPAKKRELFMSSASLSGTETLEVADVTLESSSCEERNESTEKKIAAKTSQ